MKFAWALAVTSIFAASTAPAQGQTKLKLTLDWKFGGETVHFMLAKGNGSSAAVNRVASGAYDLGAYGRKQEGARA
jgi:hypothetical protein